MRLFLAAEKIQRMNNCKYKRKAELWAPPFLLTDPSSGQQTLEGFSTASRVSQHQPLQGQSIYFEKSCNLEYQTGSTFKETGFEAIHQISGHFGTNRLYKMERKSITT